MGALGILREKLGSYPHGYEPSAALFMTFDTVERARRMRLEDRGRINGNAGRPGAADRQLDEVEAEIVAFAEGEKKQALDVCLDRLRDYGERIGRLDVMGRADAIEGASKLAIVELETEIELGLGELYKSDRALGEREDALQRFRARHGLARPAHYPRSRILHIGVLLVLALLELTLNTGFFAEASELGLLGGFQEALVIAILNIGAGVLVGLHGCRMLFHRNLLLKLAGVLIILCWILGILVLNLAVGHYRDLLSTAPETALLAAQSRFLADPFGIDSIKSWALVLLGCAASLVAMLDAFRLDDPYPGYGAESRRHATAVDAFLEIRESIVLGLEQRKNDGTEALGVAREDLRKRREDFFLALDGRRRLAGMLEQHLDWLEQAMAQLIQTYRQANRAVRRAPAPPTFEVVPKLRREPLPGIEETFALDEVRRACDRASNAAANALDQMLGAYSEAMRKLRALEEVIDKRLALGGAR